jgi:hypothetical protein
VSAWSLLGKVDPTIPPASDLLRAVSKLGPSSIVGPAVTFAPLLAKLAACSDDVTVSVAVGSKLTLKSRTDGPDGKPKDPDLLRLACTR